MIVGSRPEPEYVCEGCRRRQLAHSEHLPQGLSPEEARMIGWTNTGNGTGWLCPFCSPGGNKKLRRVFQQGMGAARSKK